MGQGSQPAKTQPERAPSNTIGMFVLRLALALGTISYFTMYFRHVGSRVLTWAHANFPVVGAVLAGLVLAGSMQGNAQGAAWARIRAALQPRQTPIT